MVPHRWYFIAWTLDVNDFKNVYVNNGMFINQASSGIFVGIGAPNLGAMTYTEKQPMLGYLDEVMIFDRALSRWQLSQLYQGLPPLPTGVTSCAQLAAQGFPPAYYTGLTSEASIGPVWWSGRDVDVWEFANLVCSPKGLLQQRDYVDSLALCSALWHWHGSIVLLRF